MRDRLEQKVEFRQEYVASMSNQLLKPHDAVILIIDDDEDDVALIQRLLERAPLDLKVNRAANGFEALRQLREIERLDNPDAPDLILLDLNMPRLDGSEFLTQLRRDPVFGSIPVVVLTTAEDELTARKAYDLGANAVVNKVASLDGMANVLRTIIEFWFSVAKRYYVD